MDYPGKELEIFDKASIWRKYVHLLVKNYLKEGILEVGAGIGSFTNNYHNNFSDITLTELDKGNTQKLRKKFENTNIKINSNYTSQQENKFNTILYMNVLEHIEKDREEIKASFDKLNVDGHLIILVPAHNELFTKFDKQIGHFRRYKVDFFKDLNIGKNEIIKLHYLDCFGYFLYFLNKIFFKDEIYPSIFKIFVWDKIFTPFTIIFDRLLGFRYGKNVLCIMKKK